MEAAKLDSFEIQCTVTSLRSRKRKRSYLRKIWYLRNFLTLLRIYRAYLRWIYCRQKKKRITWRKYDAIMWKTFSLRWNQNVMPQKIFTIVLFRFYNCQVTATFLISSRMPFQFITIVENMSIDKVLIISLKHETVDLKNNFIALNRCK